MKAGRELDALIAEKVMGCLAYWYNHTEVACGCQPWIQTEGCYHPIHGGIERDEWDGTWQPQLFIPPYSTDIAAAWHVVEKLLAIEVDRIHAGGIPGDFYFAFETGVECGDDWLSVEASAETLPLAICLAALKAVE